MKIQKIIKNYPSGKLYSVEYKVNGLKHSPSYKLESEELCKVPDLDISGLVPEQHIYAVNIYYESGKIKREEDWFQNRKHGIMREYYEDGKLDIELYWYNNGLHNLNGPAKTEWFPNGNIKSKSYWVNDFYKPVTEPDLVFIEYDITGNILKSAYYKDGIIILGKN